jgi:Uma2 family endonuclease
MAKPRIKIGPADQGRRMSLADFEPAKVRGGYLYELSRGIITVSDRANRRHLLALDVVRHQLYAYKLAHPDLELLILGGSECNLLIPVFESERHPDLSVDLTAPPPIDDATLWRHWFPEFVVEVVASCARHRDCEEKPAESLRLGVKEYWIIDGPERLMVAMRRVRSRWVETTIKPPDIYQRRRRPGLGFSCEAALLAVELT